jgi:hypothetical protein
MTAIVEDILFQNMLDAQDQIDEGYFWNETNHVLKWAIIADTFAEMLMGPTLGIPLSRITTTGHWGE